MSLSGIENRESRNNNQESSLDSRFLRESRIECQLTFEQYCRMTGITKMTGITRMTRVTGMTEGIGWGFDCLCCPWGRAFDWSCSPGGGDIWIFLRPTWRYLTADSDEKDWHRTYVSPFHASRMRHTVWKDQEVMKANENNRRLSGFHCFVFKFCLF